MGYDVDIAPAKPWNPKQPTYLDAYKRRTYKSYYVKPKMQTVQSDPRGYMETFDTFESPFRPIRRYINPDNGYEAPYKSSRGAGEYDVSGRVVHVGNYGRVVDPGGEWWRKGRRYFIASSGSWTEPEFKPSLRYIASTLSEHENWKPSIRVYKFARPHYYNSRPDRRRYLPQPPGFDDKYERLTPSEAYSEIYSPRKINNYKPEWIGFSNDGVPYERPFRKGVTMYVHRHPHLQLFPPQPPSPHKPILKKVVEYFHNHPQLQLFSADFIPESKTHPAYVGTTRYIPNGHYDHWEDHGLTIQPEVRLPEPLGAQHIPSHCPPYNEVRILPNLAGDVVGVDVLETKPQKVKTATVIKALPNKAPEENVKPAAPASEDKRRPQTTQMVQKETAKKNLKVKQL